MCELLQELNAFASQQLDFDLEEEAPPAYGDAFAARPGHPHSLFAFHCCDTTESWQWLIDPIGRPQTHSWHHLTVCLRTTATHSACLTLFPLQLKADLNLKVQRIAVS